MTVKRLLSLVVSTVALLGCGESDKSLVDNAKKSEQASGAVVVEQKNNPRRPVPSTPAQAPK